MINEVYDKNTGAILFKKDKESLTLEEAIKKIESLEKKVEHLEKIINSKK